MNRTDTILQLCRYLPLELRDPIFRMSQTQRLDWEELRLRAGRSFTYTDHMGTEREIIPECCLTSEQLRRTIELATRASVQGIGDKLSSGYLPLPGGHRMGLCGTVSMRNGKIASLMHVSSINIRIAFPIPEVGRDLVRELIEPGQRPCSTLILAPPGLGKTTLLRDLVRQYGILGIRTGVVDERGELAAMHKGVPQLDLGPAADIAEGCTKAQGILLLIRSMSPEVVCMDEITDPEDAAALRQAAGCGAAVMATAHGESLETWSRQPTALMLMEQKIFRRVIQISRSGERRCYQVRKLC